MGLRGIEFFVSDPRVEQRYVDDQLAALAAAIDGGVEFSESEGEFRIGWMLTDLVRTDAGYLQIHEPDFVHMPIRSVASLDRTFLHFASQVRMAEKLGFGDQLDLPTIAHACLVCGRYHEGERYVMERFAPEGLRDSGWYIGCADASHDHNDAQNLRRISLYEACLQRPLLAAYVGLPVGVQVLISAQGLEAATHQGIQLAV